MKKIIAGVAVLGLVLLVGTTGAHAAGSVQGRNFAHNVGCGRGGALCQYANADKAVQSQDDYTNYGGHHAGQGHGCNGMSSGNSCGGTCWR